MRADAVLIGGLLGTRSAQGGVKGGRGQAERAARHLDRRGAEPGASALHMRLRAMTGQHESPGTAGRRAALPAVECPCTCPPGCRRHDRPMDDPWRHSCCLTQPGILFQVMECKPIMLPSLSCTSATLPCSPIENLGWTTFPPAASARPASTAQSSQPK